MLIRPNDPHAAASVFESEMRHIADLEQRQVKQEHERLKLLFGSSANALAILQDSA
ncbi:hypothetical protein MPLB_1510010 [Mesorhizobium sp. ORS 3324]|nr:hypothetical protein MPLB_1510010 [Mesorhizobium sp. ORS 3324]